MEERYIACMVLHALGDTIGFKNGEWEFNYQDPTRELIHISLEITNEILYEFISLGGINHLDVKGWKISDDTIMHIETAKSLLESFNSMNKLGKILKKNYLSVVKILLEDKGLVRLPGETLIQGLERLDYGGNWDDMEYNFYAGGSGASMRSSVIGLAFHGENNRDKLIQVAIESSRITHNSTTGYLGGLVSALFTAYAIENKPVEKWGFLLMEMFDNGVVENYIKKSERGYEDYKRDSTVFINKWKIYLEDKFDPSGHVIERKSSRNIVWRGKYYMEKFSNNKSFIGSGGDDSVIISYDCLIDAGNSWEKLVIYSMMHIGDTDTTGCISGSWWGAKNGFMDVPKINYKNLESKDELISLGKKLYNKYGK